MTLKIKYFRDDITPIKADVEISDWIDLRIAESITLHKGEFKLLPLGIAMELPDGYEAHVVPRSSTFNNYGIIQTNSIGIIDNSYCGDDDQWFMPVLATREITIPKDSRICQFRIFERQPRISFEIVDKLGNDNRGGHGSTGVI